MTSTVPSTRAPRRTRLATVDIAGTAWPVYKVEAIVVGVLVFLGVLASTASIQTAVLASAAATVVAWWSLLLHEYRSQS
ncbi:MAG: hypothetical protein WBQ44_12040 [Rhodococcus sp. (in: high G+C Gram-positive bacteria)]